MMSNKKIESLVLKYEIINSQGDKFLELTGDSKESCKRYIYKQLEELYFLIPEKKLEKKFPVIYGQLKAIRTRIGA